MFHLIIAAALVAALYFFLVDTLFKKSKCKGTADMTGKTVVITGEVCDQCSHIVVNLWKMPRFVVFTLRISFKCDLKPWKKYFRTKVILFSSCFPNSNIYTFFNQ